LRRRLARPEASRHAEQRATATGDQQLSFAQHVEQILLLNQ
jgi:hypothetical protein